MSLIAIFRHYRANCWNSLNAVTTRRACSQHESRRSLHLGFVLLGFGDAAHQAQQASVVPGNDAEIRVLESVVGESNKLTKRTPVIGFSFLESFASLIKESKIVQVSDDGQIATRKKGLARFRCIPVQSFLLYILALLLVDSSQSFDRA